MHQRIGRYAAALAALALLPYGAGPMNHAALANATERVCGANALCPTTTPPDLGDQTSAEQRVIDGYITKQAGCTPDLTPNPQSVTWDPPGFTPDVGGTGNVNDADPRLGGHFAADYVNGRWHIDYQYC